jgi:GT2 family glycosyltransferase
VAEGADISIIVVNWNTCDLLERCLRSIYSYPPIQSFDIWVVDNASSDRSARMLQEQFPNVKLMQNLRNVGFAKANNQATLLAPGKLILLLNSDTVIVADALRQMQTFMEPFCPQIV